MNNFKNTTEYKTIRERTQSTFIEKKSEFIASACPVSTEQEAIDFINEIKSCNRKATHNCYAYILRENNIARYSDDGEPSGTAGVPIYETIRKEGLVDIAIVVTRYFGGILLGAGGLIRAYTHSAAMVISNAKIKIPSLADKVSVKVGYSLYGRLGAVFNTYEVKVIEENFTDTVCIELYVKTSLSEQFTKEIIDVCNGNVVVKMLKKEMVDFCDFG